MSALHYYTRACDDQSWSDCPAYVPQTIRELAISLNVWCNNGERERLIGDHLFEPVGCDPSPASEMRRLEMIVETAITWTLRTYKEPNFGAWAERWLSGEDRSVAAAKDAWAASKLTTASALAATAASTLATVSALKLTTASALATATATALSAAVTAAVKTAPTKLQFLKLILRCCAVGDRVEVCTSRSRESVLEALETGVF
ncbi:MAG: hypothetical protein L0099_07365 [Acidobacteria bacterium]|nr:hypothetical protein [Acidobacteriota bacterium]